MAYTKSPLAFFGKTYSITSHVIALQTFSHAGTTTGGSISCVLANQITCIAHGLIVGDRVRFTQVGTLPTELPVVPATSITADYYVKTVETADIITLSATRGGATLAITVSGSGANTCQVMGPLDEVTSTEATASTTGDWRKMVFGIMEMLYWRYTSLATADRPSRLSIARNSSVDDSTGNITRFYTVTITTAPTGVEVIDE